jgi:hypothetical protein
MVVLDNRQYNKVRAAWKQKNNLLILPAALTFCKG